MKKLRILLTTLLFMFVIFNLSFSEETDNILLFNFYNGIEGWHNTGCKASLSNEKEDKPKNSKLIWKITPPNNSEKAKIENTSIPNLSGATSISFNIKQSVDKNIKLIIYLEKDNKTIVTNEPCKANNFHEGGIFTLNTKGKDLSSVNKIIIKIEDLNGRSIDITISNFIKTVRLLLVTSPS